MCEKWGDRTGVIGDPIQMKDFLGVETNGRLCTLVGASEDEILIAKFSFTSATSEMLPLLKISTSLNIFSLHGSPPF